MSYPACFTSEHIKEIEYIKERQNELDKKYIELKSELSKLLSERNLDDDKK